MCPKKLTPKQEEKIVELAWDYGIELKAIAERFGISVSLVSKVLAGSTRHKNTKC